MSDEWKKIQKKSVPVLMAGIFLGFQISVGMLAGMWMFIGGL